MRKRAAVAMVVAAAAMVFAPGGVTAARAEGTIDTVALPAQIAGALVQDDPGLVTSAAFLAKPPADIGGNGPDARATTPLAGVPTDGDAYAILTNGDATLAATPNSAQNTGVDDDGGTCAVTPTSTSRSWISPWTCPMARTACPSTSGSSRTSTPSTSAPPSTTRSSRNSTRPRGRPSGP